MQVAPGLKVSSYLTMPEDCEVGTCALECGHPAARWADCHDTGKREDTTCNGPGSHRLMAAGFWSNCGATPTLPKAMLRMFQGAERAHAGHQHGRLVQTPATCIPTATSATGQGRQARHAVAICPPGRASPIASRDAQRMLQ